MNYVIYSVDQNSDMPRSNLVHIVLPVKFCSWWTFERETWKENYPFQTEKCHEIINNGSQKSTKLGFCGHVVFSFRKRKSLSKSVSLAGAGNAKPAKFRLRIIKDQGRAKKWRVLYQTLSVFLNFSDFCRMVGYDSDIVDLSNL